MAGSDHLGRHRLPVDDAGEDDPCRRGGIWSRSWWQDALERAVRAGAAAVLAGVGADQLGALQPMTLRAAGVMAAGSASVSLLLSVAASGKGDNENASFTQ
ncbi:holin [Nonomuraea sp. bgisy101]|uniref:holin n=1 Tax=Nonomuraea sp. bgisy101 TaxID=3413784 RepID=UPI003D761EE4